MVSSAIELLANALLLSHLASAAPVTSTPSAAAGTASPMVVVPFAGGYQGPANPLGLYWANITVGSGTTVAVQLDTGSADLAIYSSECGSNCTWGSGYGAIGAALLYTPSASAQQLATPDGRPINGTYGDGSSVAYNVYVDTASFGTMVTGTNGAATTANTISNLGIGAVVDMGDMSASGAPFMPYPLTGILGLARRNRTATCTSLLAPRTVRRLSGPCPFLTRSWRITPPWKMSSPCASRRMARAAEC